MPGQSLLLYAAKNGDKDAVEKIIQTMPKDGSLATIATITPPPPSFHAPQPVAHSAGSSPALEKIKAKLTSRGPFLHTASATLPTLAGEDVDSEKAGVTPLHWACLNGHLEIVKLLLDHQTTLRGFGGHVKSKNDHGETPLHWAASGGKAKVVRALVRRDADMFAQDHLGKTPLDCAKDQETKDVLYESIRKKQESEQLWDSIAEEAEQEKKKKKDAKKHRKYYSEEDTLGAEVPDQPTVVNGHVLTYYTQYIPVKCQVCRQIMGVKSSTVKCPQCFFCCHSRCVPYLTSTCTNGGGSSSTSSSAAGSKRNTQDPDVALQIRISPEGVPEVSSPGHSPSPSSPTLEQVEDTTLHLSPKIRYNHRRTQSQPLNAASPLGPAPLPRSPSSHGVDEDSGSENTSSAATPPTPTSQEWSRSSNSIFSPDQSIPPPLTAASPNTSTSSLPASNGSPGTAPAIPPPVTTTSLKSPPPAVVENAEKEKRNSRPLPEPIPTGTLPSGTSRGNSFSRSSTFSSNRNSRPLPLPPKSTSLLDEAAAGVASLIRLLREDPPPTTSSVVESTSRAVTTCARVAEAKAGTVPSVAKSLRELVRSVRELQQGEGSMERVLREAVIVGGDLRAMGSTSPLSTAASLPPSVPPKP